MVAYAQGTPRDYLTVTADAVVVRGAAFTLTVTAKLGSTGATKTGENGTVAVTLLNTLSDVLTPATVALVNGVGTTAAASFTGGTLDGYGAVRATLSGYQDGVSGTITLHAPYTKVLMHFDGANGGTTFTEENGKEVTRAGDAVTGTTVKKFGTAALSLDGTTDSVYLAATADTVVSASQDFTIECWFYNTLAVPGDTPIFATHIGSGGSGWVAQLGLGDGERRVTWIGLGITMTATGDSTINTWHHLALVNVGGTLTMYHDGVSVASSAGAAGSTADNPMTVGAYSGNAYPASNFNGSIDEVRLSKGIARYTGAFTPPVAAFTLD